MCQLENEVENYVKIYRKQLVIYKLQKRSSLLL